MDNVADLSVRRWLRSDNPNAHAPADWLTAIGIMERVKHLLMSGR